MQILDQYCYIQKLLTNVYLNQSDIQIKSLEIDHTFIMYRAESTPKWKKKTRHPLITSAFMKSTAYSMTDKAECFVNCILSIQQKSQTLPFSFDRED